MHPLLHLIPAGICGSVAVACLIEMARDAAERAYPTRLSARVYEATILALALAGSTTSAITVALWLLGGAP